MKIGIIGASFIGRTLARIAVQHGCEAMVSNSRGPASLTSTARAIHARTGTVEEAAAFGDIVVLAIPFTRAHRFPSPHWPARSRSTRWITIPTATARSLNSIGARRRAHLGSSSMTIRAGRAVRQCILTRRAIIARSIAAFGTNAARHYCIISLDLVSGYAGRC